MLIDQIIAKVICFANVGSFNW